MKIILFIIISIMFFVPIHKLKQTHKIILYLIICLFLLQNIEGFGTGIDGEALRNIASLYNSADGTLNVKNLKATGTIEADGDITGKKAIIATGKIESDGPTIGSMLVAKSPTWWEPGKNLLNKYPGGTVYMGGAVHDKGVVNGMLSWNGPPTSGSGFDNMVLVHSGGYNPPTTTPVFRHVLHHGDNITAGNITASGDITGKDITATGEIKTNTIRTNVKTQDLNIYGPRDKHFLNFEYLDCSGCGPWLKVEDGIVFNVKHVTHK